MTPQKFNDLCEEFLDKEQLIMNWKRGEYASGEDRLENFRTVGNFSGKKPSVIALIYLLKHIQSIAVAVLSGVFVWAWTKEGGEALKQRISDARNYLLLLAACLEEESEESDERLPDVCSCGGKCKTEELRNVPELGRCD